MQRRKNKRGLLSFCVLTFLFAFIIYFPIKANAADFLRSYGGKINVRFGTLCSGGEPAFDVKTPQGTVEGPFATTPFTRRYQYFSIYGLPLRNVLLLASPVIAPICAQPCEGGMCPLPAYPVSLFGISLLP